jgi:uncharacterized protein with HEPN domain
MTRDPLVYLHDILESIRNIQEDTQELTATDFYEKRIVQQAVVRNLEIIGEAVQRLPKALKDTYPTVPWRKVVAMRNKIVHEYFGLKAAVIWQTIIDDLPLLKAQITEIAKDYESFKK